MIEPEDISDVVGRKVGPQEWCCNCQTMNVRDTELILTKMHPTTVDEEQVCVQCGHYALKLEQSVLYAKRSTLNRIKGCKRNYSMANRGSK